MQIGDRVSLENLKELVKFMHEQRVAVMKVDGFEIVVDLSQPPVRDEQ